MAEADYFLKLGGILILGLLSIVIVFAVFIVLSPYVVGIGIPIIVMALMFLLIWLVIYIGLVVGAVIVYFFRPMQVKSSGKYSLEQSKEAGRRKKSK
ncbi:MAG: hypothetical protein ISS93_01655 [Candidatus Aenigmarchaeota archaeon]|nr:hypothetical protein [Candidatus Aenigmarchaeota archaeon]